MNTTSLSPRALQSLSRRRLVGLGLAALCSLGQARAGSFDDFFLAIRRDNASAVSRLLEQGFDPNTVNEQGQPGLLMAVELQSTKVIQVLLASPKIEAEVRNGKGESALMLAAIRGQTELVRALIEAGADVNKTGWTPLHYACSGTSPAQIDIVHLLLDNAAYIDAESPNGSTPLMMAAMYGLSGVVQLLLDEGADPSLRNQQGLSAIDFAQRVSRGANADAIAAAIRKRQPKGTW